MIAAGVFVEIVFKSNEKNTADVEDKAYLLLPTAAPTSPLTIYTTRWQLRSERVF